MLNRTIKSIEQRNEGLVFLTEDQSYTFTPESAATMGTRIGSFNDIVGETITDFQEIAVKINDKYTSFAYKIQTSVGYVILRWVDKDYKTVKVRVT